AGDRQPRFRAAVDDLQPEPRLALDPFEELGAVGGAAAGFRRDQPGAAHRAAAQLVAADLERLHGAVHGLLAQPAEGRKPLAQPDDARERVDDAELAVALRDRD